MPKLIDISTPKYPNTYAIVDDEDFEYLNQWKWRQDADGYAIRLSYEKKEKRKSIRMHRLIMKPSIELQVDHINHNKLDNRKCNLRICSNFENSQNRKLQKNNKTGYKGVRWIIKDQKWRAEIVVNKKMLSLGYYINKNDAARAYNQAALKYRGEFANLNTI